MTSWRRSVAALCAAQFLAALAMSQFLPFLTLYVGDLGVAGAADAARWSGVLMGAGVLAAALMAPFWGRLADRWGPKRMVVRAMAGSGLAVGLMALARSVWDLLGLRILQGSLGGFVAANSALTAAVVPEKRLGTAVGIVQSALVSGMVAGPLLGGVLLEAFGFQTMILLSGGLLLLSTGLTGLLIPRTFPQGGVIPRVRENLRYVWDVPALRSAALIHFLSQIAFLSLHPVMILFVALLAPGESRAAGLTGVVFGVTAAATLLGSLFWGRRTDRSGSVPVLTACLGACALLHVPQALVQNVGWFIGLRAALGFFAGGIQPALQSMILKTAPLERRAGVLGATFSGALLGNAVGTVSGGLAAAWLGLRAPFLLITLILGLAWFLSRRMDR